MTPGSIPEVTDDAFLGDALRILQPAAGYRAGLDAVLLAAASGVVAGQGARVLDVGAGVGVAGLCIAHRIADARVTLAEREPALVELAQRNIERNGLAERVCVVEMDVSAGGRAVHRARSEVSAEEGSVPAAGFTHVVANPPYFARGKGTVPPVPLKAAAHQMDEADLDAWCRFMATAAAADGLATMIHRADALAVIIGALDGRFGALRVLPLYPRAGEAAHRIIVQGRKGSRAPLTLLPGIAVHGTGHAFAPPVDAVLRSGEALDW